MTQRLFSLYRRLVLDHPLLNVLAVIALAAFLGSHIRGFELEASADTLVLEGDRDLAYFRKINERYQAEDFLLATYRPHGDLMSDETLADIDALRGELVQVPGVSSVTTLLDVPLLASPKVSLTDLSAGDVRTLRDPRVDRQQALAEFTTSPIYRNLLVSADGQTTAIQINLQRDKTYFKLLDRRDSLRQKQQQGKLDANGARALSETEEAFREYTAELNDQQQTMVRQVRGIVAEHRDQADIFLGGVPMIAADMIRFVKSDLIVFGSAIGVFIVLLMALIFRRWVWVLLPLATCGVAALMMLGWLAWVDWRMTVISSNFVALLLIITLSICIHLVVRYRELQCSEPGLDRQQLVIKTTRLMAKPCIYTALTTIVAFASLVISGIRPVIDFGWMMTIGVGVALVLTFILLPSGLLLLPVPAAQPMGAEKRGLTPHLARFTDRHGLAILLVAVVILVLSGVGISRLKVENRFIDYFHESTEIYQGMLVIDQSLGGTIPLDVIIDAPKQQVDEGAIPEDDPFADPFTDEGGEAISASIWFTRAGMNRLEEVQQYLGSLPETGKVLSLATLYEVLQQVTNGTVDDIQLALIQRQMPDSIRNVMVAPYFDPETQQARITIRVMETSRDLQREELLNRIRSDLVNRFGFEPEQVHLTGMLVLYNNMLQSLFKSQILTLGVVFIAIVLMFLVLFRSLPLSLIAVAPNLLAAGTVLGGMGLVGLPLDMMTITIAAIVVGIGVDDTIHYVHRYRLEFVKDRDYRAAMHRCHGSIGKAMYYTSVTIIFGFSILALSNFNPSIYFGLLTGAAMLAALAGALLLLPQLMIVFKPLGPANHVCETHACES